MSSPRLKPSYQRLDAESSGTGHGNDGEKETRHQKPHGSSWRISTCIVTSIFAAAIVVVLTALVAYGFTSSKAEEARHNYSNTCGNSSSEALSLGCSFNQLMWTWHPKHCPLYANDEYLAAEPENPWIFYTDPHTRQMASGDDWERMLNNEVGLFSEKREHVTHCVFMYVALFQIFRDDGRHTAKQVDEEHLHHCSMMMLEMLRKDETWFEIDVATPPVSYSETC
ncbi:hypothetical protein BKA61DRAFT_713800 [Leptodontidium sp. MPI-SDFR-AT-0119]|nr:hypothetical protein BKA61DRAFT_713800 [Leptodontidium sp. MPI-SDFR-AT-0119]